MLVALAASALIESPFSWRSLGIGAALRLAEVVIVACILWISWRLVGSRGNFPGFITAYSYLIAAWLLVFSLLMAGDEVGLRFKNPRQSAAIAALASSGQDTRKLRALLGTNDTYAMKVLSESEGDLRDAIRAPGMPWILFMAALRGVFTLAWLVIAWNVFRRILAISWFRSALALMIFLGIGLIGALIVIFLQMAPIVVDPNRWFDKWLKA